jgi:hypothetical protein
MTEDRLAAAKVADEIFAHIDSSERDGDSMTFYIGIVETVRQHRLLEKLLRGKYGGDLFVGLPIGRFPQRFNFILVSRATASEEFLKALDNWQHRQSLLDNSRQEKTLTGGTLVNQLETIYALRSSRPECPIMSDICVLTLQELEDAKEAITEKFGDKVYFGANPKTFPNLLVVLVRS